MKGDPIMVECENCGVGHRWIPREVEVEMAGLEARIVELEDRISILMNGRSIEDTIAGVATSNPTGLSWTEDR